MGTSKLLGRITAVGLVAAFAAAAMVAVGLSTDGVAPPAEQAFTPKIGGTETTGFFREP